MAFDIEMIKALYAKLPARVAAARSVVGRPLTLTEKILYSHLTEGEATMAQNQILTENEIADGLILTCQAHPTTDTLGIDYDDV